MLRGKFSETWETFHGRFLHFDIGVKEKTQNVHLKLIFAMYSADLTCVNGSRIQLVFYANYFLGLTYGYLNKKIIKE